MNCGELYTAMAFCAGLLLAGSDGGWFPWLNLAGAGLMLAAALLATDLLHTDCARRRGANIGRGVSCGPAARDGISSDRDGLPP